MLTLTRVRRLLSMFGWIMIALFTLEMVIIVSQVVHGTTSHFNFATPFDFLFYATIGLTIVVLRFTNFVVAVLPIFQRFDISTFAWGLRLGLIVALPRWTRP